MRGEVHILVNCPIGTFVKEKQHSAVMAKHVMCHNKKKTIEHPLLWRAPLFM